MQMHGVIKQQRRLEAACIGERLSHVCHDYHDYDYGYHHYDHGYHDYDYGHHDDYILGKGHHMFVMVIMIMNNLNMKNIVLIFHNDVFSCPGSSIPDLGQ